MKKIVALVLALVMVMGLATVASAASTSSETKMGTTTTINAAEKYAIYNAADTTAQKDWTVVSYTGVSTKVDTVDGVATTSYIPAYYTAQYTDGTVMYLYEVADAACATSRIFKGDAFVTYVAGTIAPVTDWCSDAVVFVAEGEGCGTYDADVYMNTVTYAAAEATTLGANTGIAVLDGKYVFLSATPKYPVAHDFDLTNGAATTDTELVYKSTTDNTVVGVTCAECDKTFTVVKDGKIPASYKGLVQDMTVGTVAYDILLQSEVNAPATSAPSTDKVESAETFDAGIAMYVGMSVMAAAGSAVVLKKKD